MSGSEDHVPLSHFPLLESREGFCIQCADRLPLLGSEVCGECHRPGQACETCGKPTNGESAFCRGCRVRQDEEREVERQADRLIAKLGKKLDELIEAKIAVRLAT